MSSQPTSDPESTSDDGSIESLETELAVLREENRRLREEHRRVLRTGYRHTALGFLAIAVLAGVAAVVFPAVQEILVAVAAIAGFAGLLTYYLTPERFIAATVGESTYDAHAATGEGLIDDLGLQDTPVYVPTTADTVRVFLPQHTAYDIPTLDAETGVFVIPENEAARGVTLWPTGASLIEAFERATTSPPDGPMIGEQLTEALVEQFELVDTAVIDSQEAGRLTVAITGSAYGDPTRFDHPVASVLATGLARVHDTPITLETTTSQDARYDYLLTCRWGPSDA